MQISRFTDVLTKGLLLPVVVTVAGTSHSSLVGRQQRLSAAFATIPLAPGAGATDPGGDARHNGRYLGFDTDIYPGDGAMLAWRHATSPYQWVGYYLPAPCHRDTSWVGKRTTLTQMGWGLAVVYVGQQSWDDTPPRPKHRHWRAPNTSGRCSRAWLTVARGIAEAKDAIERTAGEGFPLGTTIFLDLERMDVIPQAMREYYRSWTAHVLADGRYRPGIYAHTYNADQVYADVRAVYDSIGGEGDPPFWVAGRSSIFSMYKAPNEVGHHFAVAWQGLLDVVDTRNGVSLPIDISVASAPSPSEEYALIE